MAQVIGQRLKPGEIVFESACVAAMALHLAERAINLVREARAIGAIHTLFQLGARVGRVARSAAFGPCALSYRVIAATQIPAFDGGHGDADAAQEAFASVRGGELFGRLPKNRAQLA